VRRRGNGGLGRGGVRVCHLGARGHRRRGGAVGRVHLRRPPCPALPCRSAALSSRSPLTGVQCRDVGCCPGGEPRREGDAGRVAVWYACIAARTDPRDRGRRAPRHGARGDDGLWARPVGAAFSSRARAGNWGERSPSSPLLFRLPLPFIFCIYLFVPLPLLWRRASLACLLRLGALSSHSRPGGVPATRHPAFAPVLTVGGPSVALRLPFPGAW
jgi:hypothetical protein